MNPDPGQPSAATPADDRAAVDEPTLRRRGWRRARRTLAGSVIVAVLYFAGAWWFVHRTGAGDQARAVDAIVVMGAAQYDGRPSPQLAARLDHVVELWLAGDAALVVTTGGKRAGDRFTEAAASADYLVARGVPAGSILQVGGGTSFDSLQQVRDLLYDRGLHRVLLVSDPYHSLRIRMISQELGLTAYVSPTRTSPVGGGDAFWREVKEAGGVGVGRLIGFRRLLSITG